MLHMLVQNCIAYLSPSSECFLKLCYTKALRRKHSERNIATFLRAFNLFLEALSEIEPWTFKLG